MTAQKKEIPTACTEQEVEIRSYDGEGYKSMIFYEGWRVAYLRHADRFDKDLVDKMERHMLTDEVFVLLEGEGFLIIGEEDKVCPMEKNKLYNVKKAVWHAVCVSEDALVLIVENADTGLPNTEYRELAPGWRSQLQ